MPDHIMLIEYEEVFGSCRMEKVALINTNYISVEEAFQFIRAGEYNANIITMYKTQWTQIFKNGKQ